MKKLLVLALSSLTAASLPAAPVQKELTSLDPIVQGKSEALVKKADGFSPTGDYTLEFRLRTDKAQKPSIKIFGESGERNSFCFELADSAITFLDATQLPYPDVVYRRLNSSKWVNVRLAVTADSMYIYRNGIHVGTRPVRYAPLPVECSTATVHSSNLLRNGDFESENDISYNVIEEESNATSLRTLDGWFLYPNYDVWNSRAQIASEGASGKCLEISRYSWNSGGQWTDALAQQTVNVVPGSTYKLSFKAHGGCHEDVYYGYAKVEEIGTGKSKKIDIKNADSFVDYNLEYTPTAECRQLKVVFGLKSPGGILDWGEVPTVPLYLDDVALEGETYTFSEPAFGYTTSGEAVVDKVVYDPSGAYSPVIASISTDVDRLTLDASSGAATASFCVTAAGLSADQMITIDPSAYVTVRPPKLPYNCKNQKVNVTYSGTRSHVLDTLYIKSGATVCALPIELFGSSIKQGALQENVAGAGGKYSIGMPESGPFTIEVRAKTAEGIADGVKIYAADLEGKGFGINIGDSVLSVDNPKSLHNNPFVAESRKNSDLAHTFRIARTTDNMLHIWRDGNLAATLDGADFTVPAEYASGSMPYDENLLVNGDFSGPWAVSYVEDGGAKPYMSELQGWDIYPVEPWNSRQTIDKWELSEADGYDLTNKALKVWRYGWNKGFSDAMISQAVNVVPGKPYSLSFLAAGGMHESVKYGYVRIEEVDNPSKKVETSINSDDAKLYKMNYTPSADCRRVRVVIGLKSPGAIGSWGSVPEVPMYVDKMVLTGEKAIGKGVIGVEAADGSEVEYVNYCLGEALAPATPVISLSEESVYIKGTGKGVNVKVTASNLNPGEDIRVITPEGITALPDHVPYNSQDNIVRIKLTSTDNRLNGKVIFRSGTTKASLDVVGRGTPLEEKKLSENPVYTGSDNSWTATGFNPGEDGYTVEFRAKSDKNASSELSFTAVGTDAAVKPFAAAENAGIYNGDDRENRVRLNADGDYHTYRYAVTPDRKIFVYRDGAPLDTMRVDDYANPAGLTSQPGEYVDNMLHNPGFEGAAEKYVMADDPDGAEFYNYVQGWTILDASNGWNSRTYIEKDVVSDDMGDDNSVLGLNRYQWEDGWSDSKVSQIVDVVPGETYKFSVMAMGGYRSSDDKALGFIRIEEVQTPALGKEVVIDKSRYEFARYEVQHKASSRCTQLRVILGLKKAGKGNQVEMVKYDDACLSGKSVVLTPSLSFASSGTALEYFTFDASGAYAPEMPHIDMDDTPLNFSRTLEEQTLTVSSSDVKDVDRLTLATTGNFLVEPEELPVNSGDATVTVTFLGTRDGSGTLSVSAGDFRTVVPLYGEASELERKDISANPVVSGGNAEYLAGADTFNPGKAGYTIELAAGLDLYSGGSFEIGSLNSREKGSSLVVNDEFTGTSTEQGNVDFLQGTMIPNVGDFVYRITVTPDNLAYIFKNSEPLDTLDLDAVPADLKFVSTSESVDCDNMVRNGCFNGNYEYTQYEEANMLSSLGGWHLSGLSEWNCRAYIVNDSENPGNRVLNLQRYEWNAGWADGEASQVVNVCPGSRYTFSAEVRGGSGDGLNLATMEVSELGAAGSAKTINVSNSSSTFSTRTIDFTTSASCRQVKLSFKLASSGKDHGPKCGFYVRNVRLSGKKPVSHPGIYLNSDAPYRFRYFTYDLTGAYLPADYSAVDDIYAGDAAVCCRSVDEGIEISNMAPGSMVEIFNAAGMTVERLFPDSDSVTVGLPAGFYIVKVDGSRKASFKNVVR